MTYEVTIDTVERQLIAAARQRTTFKRIAKEIQGLLLHSWALIKERPALRNDGHNVAIYWDAAGQGSVEVGVQVVAQFEATDTVICSATPAGRVARTAHFGPYHELGAAHDAVRQWCARNGLSTRMPFWEIYGDWSDDPRTLRTDVLYLVD